MRSAAAMTLSLARSSPTKTDRTQKEMKNAERAKSDLGRGARRADGGVEVPLSTSVIDTDASHCVTFDEVGWRFVQTSLCGRRDDAGPSSPTKDRAHSKEELTLMTTGRSVGRCGDRRYRRMTRFT